MKGTFVLLLAIVALDTAPRLKIFTPSTATQMSSGFAFTRTSI
jgi:hypothetical protein